MKLDNVEQYLKIAGEEAKKSPMIKKHGALLIYRNKIISRGFNNYSNPTTGHVSKLCLLCEGGL